MRNNKLFFLIALTLFCAAAVTALGGGEKTDRVQASGRVRLVGSGNFPDLVISGKDREWYVDKKDQKKLFDLQQQEVTVEGDERVIELTYANGTSAGKRYLLKNIKIIKQPADKQ